MPRIQLHDTMGQQFNITSSNPATIGAWMAEICNLICSANTTYNHPVSMDVWPMFVFDHETHMKVPDWGPEKQFVFRPEQMKKLVDLLNRIDEIPKPPEPESEQMRREYGL